MERKLTAEDLKLLESFDFKAKEVASFADCVLKGSETGLLLFGNGGNGKSYTILETMEREGVREISTEEAEAQAFAIKHRNKKTKEGKIIQPIPYGADRYVHHQGRITPKGLVKELSAYPQSIHLIEDAETVMDDKTCWGVLRMALDASKSKGLYRQRRITWKISSEKGSYDFIFTGGIIMVGNRLMPKGKGEVEATKTRCPVLMMHMTNDELIAKMKHMCEQGFDEFGKPECKLTKDECYDVLEFILDTREDDANIKYEGYGKDDDGRFKRYEKILNLRTLKQGFRSRSFSKLVTSGKNWKERVVSIMAQEVGASKDPDRASRIQWEQGIAKELEAEEKRGKATPETTNEKLWRFCQKVGIDAEWYNHEPHEAEYKKGRNNANMRFQRRLAAK